MKQNLKLWLLAFAIGVMLFAYALPAYADDTGISSRLTNMDSSAMHFAVIDNQSEVYVSYFGRSSTFLRAEVNIKIEKKFLLLFWKDISEWTGTNTEVISDFFYTAPADGSGTYRATITLTVYGTNGVNDVIEETIETKAG